VTLWWTACLPEVPAAEGMDIDLNGVISGLS
jgi:hypothetical protein